MLAKHLGPFRSDQVVGNGGVRLFGITYSRDRNAECSSLLRWDSAIVVVGVANQRVC